MTFRKVKLPEAMPERVTPDPHHPEKAPNAPQQTTAIYRAYTSINEMKCHMQVQECGGEVRLTLIQETRSKLRIFSNSVL